ncbi:DbpA RNA binding domain-containing protein [Treponema pedis]|uniref:DbpA RNA binding domain-containing protein n=1 Tax=Treponema pedis TaxID=409322 RepID=UPI00197E5DAF|nr:DbpA RNA binding domain-containing protein [Treponema pedis]QSI04467.1 RNA-binding protein [Treponema pedis]
MLNKIIIENEEQLISYLKDAVEAIKTKENPEELNKYRRIFKKAVPLTMRSYVAAYLIKQAGFTGSASGIKKDIRNRMHSSAIKQGFKSAHIPKPRVVLPEDGATSIFIGIGRKRGIFPKDIITLLIQGAGIPRDHIGGIRILDNYSFVQVMNDEADTIIEKLNNSYYRGKSLTVSHSRKPSDDMEEQADFEEQIEEKETDKPFTEETYESQEIVNEQTDISEENI